MENILAIIALPYPIQLINGNVADGGQVQSDFNYAASQVNANAAKNGVNSDITSLTALISINSGVTITGWNISGSTFASCNLVGCTIDATTTGVTQPVGTNNTTLATTQFVNNVAFSSALPAQAGNAGKFVTTNGTVASWASPFPVQTGNAGFFLQTDGTNVLWSSLTFTGQTLYNYYNLGGF